MRIRTFYSAYCYCENFDTFTTSQQKENISLVVLDMAGTIVNEDNVVYKTLGDAVNTLDPDFYTRIPTFY